MPGPSARIAYFDRDRREVADLIQTVPDFLRPFYLQVGLNTGRVWSCHAFGVAQIVIRMCLLVIQMAQSKRCQYPGREHDDPTAASEQHCSPAVADWRRRRGFRGSLAPATHVCKQPTFCHVAEAFLCERCGWAHVRPGLHMATAHLSQYICMRSVCEAAGPL